MRSRETSGASVLASAATPSATSSPITSPGGCRLSRGLSGSARSLDPIPRLTHALACALAMLIPTERALLGVDPPNELARPRADEDEEGWGCTGCTGRA